MNTATNEGHQPVPPISMEAAAALIEPLTDLVAQAGAAILAVNRSAMTVQGKADGSPVTEADLAADRVIAEGLTQLVPAIPVLSEERHHLAPPPFHGNFFLIDPLDGTKEFVGGRNEYTVNLALICDGTPLLGIVGAPALGLIWRGLVGRGAERVELATEAQPRTVVPIHTRRMPDDGAPWIAAVSRSHGDARSESFIARRPHAICTELGSAVNLCRVAEGRADLYPRLAPTSEWDVAAGHAVLAAAGGLVTDAEGAPLRFGGKHTGFIVPDFIAWGDPSAAGTI